MFRTLQHKTWELDHSHNEPHLYTTVLHFTQSFEKQITFIPIIIIVNVSISSWTSILAKGFHSKLHLVDATLNALDKINRLVINRTFQFVFCDQSSHLGKTISAHPLKWKKLGLIHPHAKKKKVNLLNQIFQNHSQQLQQYSKQSFKCANRTTPTKSKHGKKKTMRKPC